MLPREVLHFTGHGAGERRHFINRVTAGDVVP
jgi:hypothetical protein